MNSELVSLILKDDVDGLSKIANDVPISSSMYNITERLFILPKENLTLMHIAAFANAIKCFAYLHEKCDLSVNIKSADGCKPFHYACAGHAAKCANLILNILKESCDENDDSIQSLFNDDYSNAKLNFLYLATNSGSKEILELLFENGYDVEKYKPDQKKYLKDSLEYAVKIHKIDCLEILLKYIKPSHDPGDLTLLMYAIIGNVTSAIPLLLKAGCDPGAITKDNKTALSLACMQGNYEAVRMIADALTDVDIPETIKARSAVHWICQSHDPRIAKIILSKGINANRLDDLGYPGPFHMIDACKEEESIEMLELLYSYGFNVNIHSNGKNSILGEYLTAIKKQYNVIEWLILKGADTSYTFPRPRISNRKPQTYADFMKQSAMFDNEMKVLVDKYLK